MRKVRSQESEEGNRRGQVMSEAKLERIARQQAKALKATLELLSKVTYLDSDGRATLGRLENWLEHTKPIRKSA